MKTSVKIEELKVVVVDILLLCREFARCYCCMQCVEERDRMEVEENGATYVRGGYQMIRLVY
jgi:hypothetical protein